MNKKEIVNVIAETNAISKVEAEEMYNFVTSTIIDLLSDGNDLAIHGLGKFEIKERDERTARNPQTGETLTVPAHKVVTFKVAKPVKEAVAEL